MSLLTEIENGKTLLKKNPNNILFQRNFFNDPFFIDSLCKGKKTILLTDKKISTLSYYNKLLKYLSKNHETTAINLEPAEPTEQMVVDLANNKDFVISDLVVALGGGSVLDTLKVAKMKQIQQYGIEHFALSKNPFKPESLTTLAIPTTHGTGSETTNTVVYSDFQKRKKWLSDPYLKFDTIILDPIPTLGLPKLTTFYTCLDALVHLLESLFAVRHQRSHLQDTLTGISLIWENLHSLMNNLNDLELRHSMQIAAALGGASINRTGCGIGHAFGHAFGSMFKIPHGLAVGLGFINTLESVVESHPEIELILKLLNYKSKKEMIDNFYKWFDALKIPISLEVKNFDRDKFFSIYFAEENESMRTNTYFRPTDREIHLILDHMQG